MKLRFHSNSLRLRLSQSDVVQLATAGRVEEVVNFAAGKTLTYSIESSPRDEIAATFENGRIRVELPARRVAQWAQSEEIGIESSSGGLHLIVEKDFQCLHRGSEKDADAFPNPLAT